MASQFTSIAIVYSTPYCLLRRSKKTSKLRVTGLCAGNSPESGEFPTQRASNAENVSIWWRHNGKENFQVCALNTESYNDANFVVIGHGGNVGNDNPGGYLWRQSWHRYSVVDVFVIIIFLVVGDFIKEAGGVIVRWSRSRYPGSRPSNFVNHRKTAYRSHYDIHNLS